MRVRVGHRLGRRAWVSVGLPVGRRLRPRPQRYRHAGKAERKACRYEHLRERDVLLCEAEMRGGSVARDLLVAEFSRQDAESMRAYLAADRAKSQAWLAAGGANR